MNKIFSIIAVFSFVILSNLHSEEAPPFIFEPSILNIGSIMQGETKDITLKGQNISPKTIELEMVMSQNVGYENFKYPTKLKPGEKFEVKCQFNSQFLEGDIRHTIVLVEKGGKPWLTYIEGKIKNPIKFSNPVLDLGYYQANDTKTWTIYAWNPLDTQSIDLNLDSTLQKRYQVKITQVKLNVDKPENISEGGKTKGLKIEIKYVPRTKSNTQKSISEIVSFKSKNFPMATPEIQIIGYWK